MTPMEPQAAPDAAATTPPVPLDPEPTPAAKRGLGRLLVGSVLWPRSTFAYLRDHGGRSWLLPLLLVLVLTVASRAVALPIEKAQADAAMAALQAQLGDQGAGKNGNIQIFTAGGPGGPASFGATTDPSANRLLAYGLPALGVAWDWLLRGGILLGLAWLLGGRPGGGAMFRMAGWTLIPTVARLAVALAVMLIAHRIPASGLQGLGAGPAGGSPVNFTISSGDSATGTDSSAGANSNDKAVQVGPGGGNFGPSFLPLLQASFLGALDLYTLWGLLLMLIGVAVTARLGWIKAALSTAGYWAVSLALATLPPLLSFMLLTLAGPGRVIGP